MNKKMKIIILAIAAMFISLIIILTNKSLKADESMAGMPEMTEEEMDMSMEVHSMNEEDLIKEMDKEDVLLVDIRESYLFEKNHIPNAINIPFDEFQNRFQELDKNKIIIFICHVGPMGDAAGQFLLENGYMHVANLAGGMAQWNGPLAN